MIKSLNSDVSIGNNAVKTCRAQLSHLHGLSVLFGVVGLCGGDIRESIVCDHSDPGRGRTVGVVVPLFRLLVLIVAVSWLRWIL